VKDLRAATAANDVIPVDGSWPQVFRAHKVLALTTKRMLLLDYYGWSDVMPSSSRHAVETVLQGI
jgi:hypothetical protein